MPPLAQLLPVQSLMLTSQRAPENLRGHFPCHAARLVRERFWVSTQPMEEPEHPWQLAELLDEMGMDDRILFSTDYPHWDFDAPDAALPATLPPALRTKILHDNAAALYRLHPEGAA